MPKTRFPDRASSWRGVPRISHRERTVLTPTARPDHLAADKNVKGKGKGKTIPVRTWTGSECFRRLRIPDFGTFSNLGGNVFSPTHRSPLPPLSYHTHICLRLSRPQDHSVAGRIMSMKNSNDTIGNRTRDFPACSAVPQLTAPPCAPPPHVTDKNVVK